LQLESLQIALTYRSYRYRICSAKRSGCWKCGTMQQQRINDLVN